MRRREYYSVGAASCSRARLEVEGASGVLDPFGAMEWVTRYALAVNEEYKETARGGLALTVVEC